MSHLRKPSAVGAEGGQRQTHPVKAAIYGDAFHAGIEGAPIHCHRHIVADLKFGFFDLDAPLRIDPFSHTEFEHIIHDEVGSAPVEFAEPFVGADGHIGLEPGVFGQSEIPYSEFIRHLGNGFALSFELDGAFVRS